MSYKIEDAKNNSCSFIAVLVIAIPLAGLLFMQYMSNNTDRLSILEQKNKFEIYKSNTIKELEDREKNLQNINRENELLKEKYKICTNQLTQYKKMNNVNTQVNEIEKNIMSLQNKFSSLGVDLNSPNWCDKDYTKRFYEASAILSSISTQASRFKELEKYNAFVFNNQARISVGKGTCNPIIYK